MKRAQRIQSYVVVLGFLAGIFCLPGNALAKKCPKGQYGIFKCIKCPANTYAYKDHILTRIGCKKCPKGSSSRAGSRSCTDNPCVFKVGSKAYQYPSGKAICIPSKGKKLQCYRGKNTWGGACAKKSCQGKANGQQTNLPHGYKFCQKSDLKQYTCKYGIWIKGSPCPKTGCTARRLGRTINYKFGALVCVGGKQHQCKSSHWFPTGKTCK